MTSDTDELSWDEVVAMNRVPRVRRLMDGWYGQHYSWRFRRGTCERHGLPEVTYRKWEPGHRTYVGGSGIAVRCTTCESNHRVAHSVSVSNWRADHPERNREITREAVRRHRAARSAS